MKGQTQQVFIFMMALIIFGAIVFFGYSAIQDFIERGEQVAFVQFKNSLEQKVRTLSTEFGSVMVYDGQDAFAVPSQYRRICFIDYDQNPAEGTLCDPQHADFDAIGCDLWQTDFQNSPGWQSGDSNVVLVPPGVAPISVHKIRLEGGVANLCFSIINGRLNVRMEGRGDNTLITQP